MDKDYSQYVTPESEKMLEHFNDMIANPKGLPKGKEVFVDKVNPNRILNPLVAKDIEKARIRKYKLGKTETKI